MRSNRLLFAVLYFLGLALCISLFVTFVPPEGRTNVMWMNFAICLFIYTGLWGRYSLLYPLLGRFSDNVPTLSMYWISFGWYAVAAVVAMILFWILNIGFDKQALLQECILFAFIAAIVIGLGASNFMKGETERVQCEIGGVRRLQQKVAMMKVSLSGLPSSHSFVATSFGDVEEAVTFLCGCNNPKARDMENRIEALLDKLQMQCTVNAPADECLSTVKMLKESIALRKSIANI